MPKRYYIAYGSNLNIRQMRERCPGAKLIGTSRLDGWELHFRKSVTGYYLTIEPKKGGAVPVAVWEITEADERRLDRCEGFPNIYHKQEMTLDIVGIVTGKVRRRRAFAYIMNEGRPIGKPAHWYVMTCLQGYDSFGFDINILADAYDESKGVKMK